MEIFSGSYPADWVRFLLNVVPMPKYNPTVDQKECLIQSGVRHYSEMISVEELPEDYYIDLYRLALAKNAPRMGSQIASLARQIAARRSGEEVVLVSLARGGTPIGVLLYLALKELSRSSVHYSVSIIRDRGIDECALDHILSRHGPENLVFVDGWTGKGSIKNELTRSVKSYCASRSISLSPKLVVLSDLAGVADLAATAEDYLIPSSILNAVVSGLVSRSIWSDPIMSAGEFHGCLYYDSNEFLAADQSVSFVETVMKFVRAALIGETSATDWNFENKKGLSVVAEKFVDDALTEFNIVDRNTNRVKPGIGESARALLRRVPDFLLVRDADDSDVKHLIELANRRGAKLIIRPELPYRAAVIIKKMGGEL